MRKEIHRTIRHDRGGVQLSGTVDAVVAVNQDQPGTVTSSTQHIQIVQRSGHQSARRPRRADPESTTKEA